MQAGAEQVDESRHGFSNILPAWSRPLADVETPKVETGDSFIMVRKRRPCDFEIHARRSGRFISTA